MRSLGHGGVMQREKLEQGVMEKISGEVGRLGIQIDGTRRDIKGGPSKQGQLRRALPGTWTLFRRQRETTDRATMCTMFRSYLTQGCH